MATTRTLLLSFILLLALKLTAQESKSSLLWQVSGPGIKDTSYLYGTIHIKDKRVFEFNDSLMPKMDLVDAFAMEIELNPENLQKMMTLMLLPDGQKLKDFYKRKDYKLIEKHVKEQLGIDIEVLENFKPMVLISMLTTQDASSVHTSLLTVDEYLKQHANDAGKQIISIETVEEQMKVFEQIDPQSVIDMIKNFDTSVASLEQMILAYQAQDPEKVLAVMYKDNSLEELEQTLIIDRNKIMAERFMDMTQEQTVMFAVGAGHLGGADGVINLLREKGLTVSPIIAGHTPAKTNEATEVTIDGYKIEFPGKPEKNVQYIPNTSQQMTMYIYKEQNDGVTLLYILGLLNMGDEIDDTDLDNSNLKLLLSSVVSGMITKIDGELIEESELFQWNGFDAYEADIKHKGGLLRIRCLFQDKKLLMLQVATTENELPVDVTDEFYNTLELVEALPNE